LDGAGNLPYLSDRTSVFLLSGLGIGQWTDFFSFLDGGSGIVASKESSSLADFFRFLLIGGEGGDLELDCGSSARVGESGDVGGGVRLV